jgi:hypothetical protein
LSGLNSIVKPEDTHQLVSIFSGRNRKVSGLSHSPHVVIFVFRIVRRIVAVLHYLVLLFEVNLGLDFGLLRDWFAPLFFKVFAEPLKPSNRDDPIAALVIFLGSTFVIPSPSQQNCILYIRMSCLNFTSFLSIFRRSLSFSPFRLPVTLFLLSSLCVLCVFVVSPVTLDPSSQNE